MFIANEEKVGEPLAREIVELEAPGDLERVLDHVRRRTGAVALTGLRGAARAAVGARLVEAHGSGPVLFLTATAKSADALEGDLRAALGERDEGGRVRSFPRHDTPPYDRFSPQPFVVTQRMDVLHRWCTWAPEGEPGPVAVAPWTALAMRVPSRAALRAHTLRIAVGESVDRDALVARLLAAGYSRSPLVEERGEIAVRGGIVDFFPPQRPRPVRIELSGDEIESIREFDPASQRSQLRLEEVLAAPPREVLLDRELLIGRSAAIRQLARDQRVPAAKVDEILDALLRGHVPPGAEALAPLLAPELEDPLEVLPPDALLVVDDLSAGRERLVRYFAEALENFAAAREGGRVASTPSGLFVEPDALVAAVVARRPVLFDALGIDAQELAATRFAVRAYAHDELRAALVRSRTHERALEPLADRLLAWRDAGYRAVLAVPALSAAERLRALLMSYGVRASLARDPRPVWRWSRPGEVEIRIARLSEGFDLPIERLAVVTDEEAFGPRERRRTRARWPESAAALALAQLQPGDLLVHADHGIGVYRGLVELRVAGAVGEFLRIEYEGADKLFVPVHRLNLVQRYLGAEGFAPRLDRLGGNTWERARRQVRKSLKMMAAELLRVHAERALARGFAFSPRDRSLEEFEAAFPYEETPDQLAAIEEVLADMARPQPMDRLVCGDVGYGKTEVAMRAALRAVMDGKQVAVLVPTTILAQQHEETFRKRFAGYPVRVESYSRFRTDAESRAVRDGLADGTIDIVIGTHRLLQPAVRFRDLGLLVVDEEHRFGVRHKERIKQWKASVDVLTLTATPIPRTLQMALSGLRDLSVIETPPVDRLAIRTQVARFSEELVREAILREVRRGGQVFFVHNRVQTIGSVEEMLRRVVPEVKVIVAHGQMGERQLEDRMLAFLRGESDVLLCTTIIESGLDIPRVNTIVIHRGDALGLAQLYQLRGRVGRSTRRAYCYLLVPAEEAMTADARRRLEAIQDLSELGSGFRLASLDLEIRGAGNLLGEEQSGNLAAVGYETYMEMLEEAVEELRGTPRAPEVDPEIRLPVEARLPDEYVPDVSQRLVLYKRLAGARDDAEVDRIRDELLDRFGPLPDAALRLIELIRLKILARRLGVAAVEWTRGEIALSAGPSTRIDPELLVRLVKGEQRGVRVSPDHRIYAPAPSAEPDALLPVARRLLEGLASRISATPVT